MPPPTRLPEPRPMRTAIYARFSSQLQKDSSIEDQVRVCSDRARAEGWPITEVFSDYAISGAVRQRPGLNALLDHLRAGHADQVLCEAIDRISRDQEDLAGIHKRVRFIGARIITLSEGPIDELQIGFKGTMASLFRKDLADKIRRGQSGRIAAGRAAGNVVYGYRKVHRLDARGEAERGLREIDPDQAEIVRRVVAEYLAGLSPLAIARRLNDEGVPGPAGGTWTVSMINGDSVRGNGLLCNPIYAGQLVYNRTTMVRDPDTRRRLPRPNPPDQWQVVDAPHLRIVDAESWAAVRARKAAWHGFAFHKQARPKRLLSGLVKCGQCHGNYVVIGAEKWGCANARKAGTCTNRRTIQTARMESRVLAGLRTELLSPDRVSMAVKAYHDERQRLLREASAHAATARRRAAELDQRIARLVSAIAQGAGEVPEIIAALQSARAARSAIDLESAEQAAAQVITLHPGIADAYRAAIETMLDPATADPATKAETTTAIRSLVDAIILHPSAKGRGLDIELKGKLAAMLSIAQGKPTTRTESMLQVVAEERCGFGHTLGRVFV